MNTLYLTFLKFIKWQLEFELAISRSTGRRPSSVAQLSRDLAEINMQIMLKEMSL